MLAEAQAGLTYALVVYIPLRSVPEDAGRVEYLVRFLNIFLSVLRSSNPNHDQPKTHLNGALRVERDTTPWSEAW